MFQLRDDLRKNKLEAEYFNWNGTRAGELAKEQMPPLSQGIATAIREHLKTRPECRVVLVGNSWGGHSSLEVCQCLSQEPPVRIDLLMLLDPSSAGRTNTPKEEGLPANVQKAALYHTHNAFVWQGWPGEDRVECIDLGNRKNGFMTTPLRAYDAAFNWQAHVAAEWDERIHDDIQRRIQLELNGDATGGE